MSENSKPTSDVAEDPDQDGSDAQPRPQDPAPAAEVSGSGSESSGARPTATASRPTGASASWQSGRRADPPSGVIAFRRPSDVALFTILTLGVYAVWWRFRTTRTLNRAGAEIPHPILTLVPVVHWWWTWRWAKGVERVQRQASDARWAFWVLATVPLGESFAQAILNPSSAQDGQREPVPRGAMLALQIALPIVLCGAAIGVHWALNVPDVVKESPRDQGAKKKKKKKKKARKKKKRKPRSAAALDRSWKRWSKRDFDDEPVSVDWAHRHQSLVRKAFLAARTAAFEGAPEQPVVTLESADCHTIRCRLLMRSAFPHQNDAIAHALSRLQSEGEPLWRDYEAFRIATPEGMAEDDEDGKPNDYVQVTVAFTVDDVKPKTMKVPESEADAGGIVAVPQAPAGEADAGAGAGADAGAGAGAPREGAQFRNPRGEGAAGDGAARGPGGKD